MVYQTYISTKVDKKNTKTIDVDRLWKSGNTMLKQYPKIASIKHHEQFHIPISQPHGTSPKVSKL